MKAFIKFTFKIILLSLALTLFNCNKDDILNENTIENVIEYPYLIEKVSEKDIFNNLILKEKLESIKATNKEFKENKSESKYVQIEDFYIETNTAIYIGDDVNNYHSYTFPLIREVDNGLEENLLLSLEEEGNYRAYLIIYNLTNEDKENLLLNEYVNLEDKTSIIDIDIDINSLFDNKIVYNPDGTCSEVTMVTGVMGFPVEQIKYGVPCPGGGSGDGEESSDPNNPEGDSGYQDPYNPTNTGETNNNNDPESGLNDNNTSGPNGNDGSSSDTLLTTPNVLPDGDKLAIQLSNLLDLNEGVILDWIKKKSNWSRSQAIYDSIVAEGCTLMGLNGTTSECEIFLNKTKMSLIVEYVEDDSDPKWDESRSGFYSDNPALEFDAAWNLPNSEGGGTMYRLVDRRYVLLSTMSRKIINPQDAETIGATDFPIDGTHHYIYETASDDWYEYGLPVNVTGCLSCDLENFFQLALENGIVITGRYFLPIEDLIILISGEDFYGVESSRAVAGGFLLIDLVPGAKIIKGIKLIKYGDEVVEAAGIVIKSIDNIYKTQKAIIKDVVEGIEELSNNTRRGNFGEIIVDVDIFERGYEFINRTDGVISLNDTAIHTNGIDHIIKNPNTNEYILIETKYNRAILNQSTANGPQMSQQWIENHLNNLPNELADIGQEIIDEGYTSVLAEIATNGNITYTLLNDSGQKIIGSSWTP